MIITNAFSINMINETKILRFIPVSVEQTIAHFDGSPVVSAIGHKDTAAVVSSVLGIEIPENRINVKIPPEGIIVAQYSGPRLEEGSTSLPAGAKITFWWVGE